MTRLQWFFMLYQSGLVIECGYRRKYGVYPLRWLGKIMLHRMGRRQWPFGENGE